MLWGVLALLHAILHWHFLPCCAVLCKCTAPVLLLPQIEVFRRTIEELPATEGPEIFGLHSNADIAFRTNQARRWTLCSWGVGACKRFLEGATQAENSLDVQCVTAKPIGTCQQPNLSPLSPPVLVPQVQAAVQLILDTQPKGGVAAGGLSREEVADGIAEDLLAKCPSVFDGAHRAEQRAVRGAMGVLLSGLLRRQFEQAG